MTMQKLSVLLNRYLDNNLDFQEMHNAYLRAIDTEAITNEAREFIRKPSHYTITETVSIVEKLLSVVEAHEARRNA